MEKQIYYIIKDSQDQFLPDRFGSAQEAAEEINAKYHKALDIGIDKRDDYFIYRVDFQRELSESGLLLSENQSIRIWIRVAFSEINNRYIMDI